MSIQLRVALTTLYMCSNMTREWLWSKSANSTSHQKDAAQEQSHLTSVNFQ